MKTCPVCQQTLTDTAKFCYYCGASLSGPVTEAPVPMDTAVSADLPDTPAEPIVLPEPEPEPVIAPEPEPVIVPEPEPVIAPEPEQVIVPEPEQVIVPEPEPVIAPEPEPVIVPEPEPVIAPEPKPVIAPEPKPEPVCTPDIGEQKATPVVEQKSGPIIVATDSHSLMTTPGYIFTTILFHIPIIGLIFMIVWGCGKTKNISRKRFSLACLIMRLILYIAVLSAAVFVLICFSGVINSLWEAVKPILFA